MSDTFEVCNIIDNQNLFALQEFEAYRGSERGKGAEIFIGSDFSGTERFCAILIRSDGDDDYDILLLWAPVGSKESDVYEDWALRRYTPSYQGFPALLEEISIFLGIPLDELRRKS